MKATKLFMSMAGMLLVLMACNRDHSYSGEGQVELETDWTQRGEGVDIPASYTVKAGAYSGRFTAATNTIPHFFAPGDYTFYVYNEPEHISVDGTLVTVQEVEDSNDDGDRNVQNLSEYFFSGKKNLSIEECRDYEMTVNMQQQVRLLNLIINCSGGALEQITDIEGTLSGVAGTLDIDTDIHASPSNVTFTFTKDTDGKWSAALRLLGVAGMQQNLALTFRFWNDTHTHITTVSDFMEVLTDFNTDKLTPLSLYGYIIEIPTEIGFTATISPWEPVDGDTIVVTGGD